MKLVNDHPLFAWAACSNPASGIAKICIAHESFWLKDCARVDGNIFIGTVDNKPCSTNLHGLRLGDTIHFIVNIPQQEDAQYLTGEAPPLRPNSSASKAAASLAFTQCKVTLPGGTVIVTNLHYVADAYSRGPDQYPANLVKFTPEQSAQIDATLDQGEDADFVAECINCAIAEGDCTVGSIASLQDDPTKQISWALLT